MNSSKLKSLIYFQLIASYHIDMLNFKSWTEYCWYTTLVQFFSWFFIHIVSQLYSITCLYFNCILHFQSFNLIEFLIDEEQYFLDQKFQYIEETNNCEKNNFFAPVSSFLGNFIHHFHFRKFLIENPSYLLLTEYRK